MPIEFEGTNGQRITFAVTTPFDNLSTLTAMARINADTIADGEAPRIFVKNVPGVTGGWNLELGDEATGSGRENNLIFIAGWDGTFGVWETGTNTISTGTEHHVAATYNHTNVANNPIFYIDGVASTAFEIQTPVGSVADDSGQDLILGERIGDGAPFDGYQSDYRIYNRIVSAVDIKSIFDANSISPNGHRYGLVFHVPGIGASGLQTWEGQALSASNIVRDQISGLAGVPNNSPIGHDEVLRSYGR